jgi:hypothetical protein
VVVPILFIIASLLASVFTSFVVSTSNIEVLVSSPLCGQLNFTLLARPETDSSTYMSEMISLSTAYAKDCYHDEKPTAAACHNIFEKSRLPLPAFQRPHACPFASSMCLGGERLPAVEYDTGLLDLNTYLGANFKQSESVKFRRKTVCAVLQREGHYKIFNATEASEPALNYESLTGGESVMPDEQLLVLYYGNRTEYLQSESEQLKNATFTYIISPRKRRYASGSAIAFVHEPLGGVAGLDPLPTLARNDADVAFIAIFPSKQLFVEPVDDLIFSAHRPVLVPGVPGLENTTRYLSDHHYGIIGCTEQFQYCIDVPSKPEFCSPLSGNPEESSISTDTFPGAAPVQLAGLRVLISANRYNSMQAGVLRDDGLNASNVMEPVHSLPPNQWTVETTGFLSYLLAATQRWFTDYAIGPQARHHSAGAFTDKPVTDGEKQLCHSQKMRKAGGFANINYFGLVFIIVVTSIIVILDLVLLRFLIFLSKFRHALAPRINRWIQDGVWQLQRRAFEAQEKGVWEQVDDEVPLTRSNDKMAELMGTAPEEVFVDSKKVKRSDTLRPERIEVLEGSDDVIHRSMTKSGVEISHVAGLTLGADQHLHSASSSSST